MEVDQQEPVVAGHEDFVKPVACAPTESAPHSGDAVSDAPSAVNGIATDEAEIVSDQVTPNESAPSGKATESSTADQSEETVTSEQIRHVESAAPGDADDKASEEAVTSKTVAHVESAPKAETDDSSSTGGEEVIAEPVNESSLQSPAGDVAAETPSNEEKRQEGSEDILKVEDVVLHSPEAGHVEESTPDAQP